MLPSYIYPARRGTRFFYTRQPVLTIDWTYLCVVPHIESPNYFWHYLAHVGICLDSLTAILIQQIKDSCQLNLALSQLLRPGVEWLWRLQNELWTEWDLVYTHKREYDWSGLLLFERSNYNVTAKKARPDSCSHALPLFAASVARPTSLNFEMSSLHLPFPAWRATHWFIGTRWRSFHSHAWLDLAIVSIESTAVTTTILPMM